MWCKGHTDKAEVRMARWSERLCKLRKHQKHLSWDALTSQQSSPSWVSSLPKGPSQVLRGQEALGGNRSSRTITPRCCTQEMSSEVSGGFPIPRDIPVPGAGMRGGCSHSSSSCCPWSKDCPVPAAPTTSSSPKSSLASLFAARFHARGDQQNPDPSWNTSPCKGCGIPVTPTFPSPRSPPRGQEMVLLAWPCFCWGSGASAVLSSSHSALDEVWVLPALGFHPKTAAQAELLWLPQPRKCPRAGAGATWAGGKMSLPMDAKVQTKPNQTKP